MLRPPEPFQLRGDHLAIALPGAVALFTTRGGGHSKGPYTSLNLGLKTADNPEAVAANRLTLENGVGRELAWVHQVHGNQVVTVGAPSSPLPEADGQVTSGRALGVAVVVADCLPIALASGEAVAILHAGWRGLASGVIKAGVHELRRVSPRAAFHAAIGPGAGPCCYEVGEEVHAHFGTSGRTLDLKAIARAQLEAAGAEVVHDLGLCTMCEPALFFSHRRDGGVTGRQAGVAWLN
jgi:YfiH family protein